MGSRSPASATLAVHGDATRVFEFDSLADAVFEADARAGDRPLGILATVRDRSGRLVYATDGARSWSPGEEPAAVVAEWGKE